jgi:DNA-binding NtrC family response regulator
MSNSNAPLILCVDGESAALKVRSLLLSSAGYRVVTARNGGEALQILQLNPVEMVIFDLWQAECAGVRVAGEVKRIHPEMPVILLSGLMEPPIGADEVDLVLTKGITPAQFLEAIRGMLDKSRRREETARDEEAS